MEALVCMLDYGLADSGPHTGGADPVAALPQLLLTCAGNVALKIKFARMGSIPTIPDARNVPLLLCYERFNTASLPVGLDKAMIYSIQSVESRGVLIKNCDV